MKLNALTAILDPSGMAPLRLGIWTGDSPWPRRAWPMALAYLGSDFEQDRTLTSIWVGLTRRNEITP